MTFRTISSGTPILVENGNVLTETTLGEFIEDLQLGNDEVSELRAKLQKGLSYDGGGRGARHFTVMPRR